ncbi:hypothetical protein ONO39_27150, partial [Salmonella enterica subsp. enterica serovar Anatum]|nr:hypothetical protein [Salmonella enterica subsp. enterica serovar Anatum]
TMLEENVHDILCSALVDDCIERAKSIKQGGAKYDWVSGLQVGHQIATNDLPKKASPIKWKIIHETLRTWGENVYCLSSFKPDNT